MVDGKLSRENRGENGFVCYLVGRGERKILCGAKHFPLGPTQKFSLQNGEKRGEKSLRHTVVQNYPHFLLLSLTPLDLFPVSRDLIILISQPLHSNSKLSPSLSLSSTFYCINLLCKFVAHIVSAQLGR